MLIHLLGIPFLIHMSNWLMEHAFSFPLGGIGFNPVCLIDTTILEELVIISAID
jgi:hypothetical protein